MNTRSRGLEWALWGLLALTMAGITGAFVMSRLSPRQAPYPVITHGYPPIILTNHLGKPLLPAELKGKVVIADVIFTRCPGPCTAMTKRMAKLQQELAELKSLHFLTITTDPEFDTPERLKEYGQKHGADFNRWTFATGTKQQIALMAREGLKLVAEPKDPKEQTSPEDLFIHSTVFVILDKQDRLRGTFDSTEPAFREQITNAARQLLKEKS